MQINAQEVVNQMAVNHGTEMANKAREIANLQVTNATLSKQLADAKKELEAKTKIIADLKANTKKAGK